MHSLGGLCEGWNPVAEPPPTEDQIKAALAEREEETE
jgi:hypothetical protein